MKLDPGTIVERYVVESLLGHGGTAMVYRVVHQTLKTRYALKVMSVTSEAIRDRMVREGQVQASLKHLNVVAVTDVLTVQGNPGLVMEFIEGPTLEKALQKYTLSMNDAEVLFRGILSGVRHAHSRGLVHRDLKPANVMLARTETGFVPKVTDFGLAKVVEGDQQPEIGATRAGIAMGTPSYMAPEQIRDAKTVDQRADLFSLGCILYELILRQRAFPGDEALSIYNAVCDGHYVPPRALVPEIPDRLDVAIRGCLLVDRDGRIPDCDTLLRVLNGEITWRLPDEPSSATPAPAASPRVEGPAMPVAARREQDGGTPAPIPSRSHRPGVGGGLALVEHDDKTIPIPGIADFGSATIGMDDIQGHLDGTLGGDEPLEDRRTPWALIAVAVGVMFGFLALFFLILVGGVVGGLLGVVGPTQVEGPTQVGPTDPVVVQPLPAPEPEVVPEPVATPDPAVAPAPDVKPQSPKPSPQAAPVAPVEASPKPKPAPAAVVVPVTVKLLTQPPTASLHVAGVERGRTPAKIDLLPGSYKIRVASGESQGVFEIDVAAGADNRWCYHFASERVFPGSCPKDSVPQEPLP